MTLTFTIATSNHALLLPPPPLVPQHYCYGLSPVDNDTKTVYTRMCMYIHTCIQLGFIITVYTPYNPGYSTLILNSNIVYTHTHIHIEEANLY